MTRFYGAVLIICTMLGAIVTLVVSNQLVQIPIPSLVLVLAVLTAKNHRSGSFSAVGADTTDISHEAD